MTNPPMPPISKTGNDRFSRILFWVGILIIPTILIIQVLVYQPFFAHFDDARNLQFVESRNLGQFLLDTLRFTNDMYGYLGANTLGGFINGPTYLVGAAIGPVGSYLINVLLVVTLILLYQLSFSRVLVKVRFSFSVSILATFLFPYTFELYFFVGLPEKGVIAAATSALVCILTATKLHRVSILFALTLIMSIVLLLAGRQILLFIPGFILIVVGLYRNQMLKIAQLNVLLGFFVFSSLVIAVGALSGDYSSSVRSGDYLSNIRQTPSILILACIAMYLAFVVSKQMHGRSAWSLWVPLILMVTFEIGVILYGSRNYWLAPFGVMFGSAVAVVVGNLKSVKLQQIATVGLIMVTVGWTLYRIPQVFEPLHGIGAFTQGQIAKDLADERAVIYTSCVEGSGHFNYYTERKWGVTPEFKPLEGDNAGYRFGIPADGQYVFGDRRLCAAPGEIAEWDVVWASPGDDGFRLYKRPA